MPDVKAFIEAMKKMKIPKEAIEQILRHSDSGCHNRTSGTCRNGVGYI